MKPGETKFTAEPSSPCLKRRSSPLNTMTRSTAENSQGVNKSTSFRFVPLVSRLVLSVTWDGGQNSVAPVWVGSTQ